MANYEIDPDVLQPFLPPGVELDFYNGKTFVSLVGFMFQRTRLFRIPIPFLGTFEEVNLRFYVRRTEGDVVKRGVVFINETVPFRLVAWMANKLYKEHYIAIPTRNQIHAERGIMSVRYEWKTQDRWNHLSVKAGEERLEMEAGSMEEFIFEHYYGYTKISALTQEYRVNHSRWLVHKIMGSSIDCDFGKMYGPEFTSLRRHHPHSVFLAAGSPVTVQWKRTTF